MKILILFVLFLIFVLLPVCLFYLAYKLRNTSPFTYPENYNEKLIQSIIAELEKGEK